MAVCVGDLDDRQIERLRAELIELLARRFAYPPFFDYAAGEARVRPADRAKRREIEAYVRGVSFAPLDRTDVSAPEVRRFLEGVILRYIEHNPALGRRFVARRVPELRAWAPKAVATIQQGLVAHTRGNAPTYGGPRPAPDWAGPTGPSPHATEEDLERNTAVLAATLVRTREGLAAAPVGLAGDAIAASARPAAPIAAPAFQSAQPRPVETPPARRDTREPTPEAYRMYGEYLDDLNTENMPTVAALPATTPNGNGSPGSYGAYNSSSAAPATSSPRAGNGNSGSGYNAGYNARPSMPAPSIPAPSLTSGGFTTPAAESRQDDMIFRQLRYQLEAYVKRVAKSNGLLTIAGGEPSRMVDLLRRSKLVDEADLRLVEGILALTDRVSAQGHATVADYRQAMMLYLLYHRGHLGE